MLIKGDINWKLFVCKTEVLVSVILLFTWHLYEATHSSKKKFHKNAYYNIA